MQAKSDSLKAEFSNEQDKNQELCKRINNLKAALIDGTERALYDESQVDCLRIELAAADADAKVSQRNLAVITPSLFVSM